MLACQIEAKLTLHRANQVNLRLLAEDFFDECKVGEVIFNIEDFALAGERGVLFLRRFHLLPRTAAGRRFGPRKVDPKSATSPERAVRSNGAAHRVHETLAKR